MEIVKYLCEFFFCHFWHFLGLVVVLETIFGNILLLTLRRKTDKEEEK